MLLIQYPNSPPITELAERELRLAGLRIKPAIDGQSRTSAAVDLRLLNISDAEVVNVKGLPGVPRIENIRWSPDGRNFSFTHATDDGLELWVVDTETAAARRLTDRRLSLAAGNAPTWLDAENVVAAFVPRNRSAEPAVPTVPAGPVIEESIGREAPARTYQDLLQSPYDESLFDYYLTVQIARVGLNGEFTPIAEPGIAWEVSPSPDGRYLLVEWVHRPYSYRVPVYRFPMRVEILGRDGSLVHLVADLPLQEEIPMAFGSVATGPRSFSWRADAASTLVWAEAQDGGDARVDAEVRDKLFVLDAPFDGEPTELATLGLRYAGIRWGDGDLALVSESWWKTRELRVWRVEPDQPSVAPTLMVERSYEDRYSDPGTPDMRTNAFGRSVIRRSADGRSIFLIGQGASPEGDRPFLDQYDLATGGTTRLFRSEAPWYETPVSVLSGEELSVLTRRESPDTPPNYFVRDLDSGGLRQVTKFPHPAPALADVQKELIRYKRADGVDLTGTLYLPPGWEPGDEPLPVLMWAYPTEYKSADA
ncbi:MAG: TolB family protein, partial [Gemmatimonadota bacterium]